jgi:hypothetical protein
MTIEELRNLYPDGTAYLVGKGPSLWYLDASYFGPGPVITLNQAILVVQELGLPNPIYSLQKEGCKLRGIQDHECKSPMAYPSEDITLILAEYSRFCLSKHKRRIFIDVHNDFGLSAGEMSVRVGIAIIKVMGCTKIIFACCDSLVGNMRTFDPEAGESGTLMAGHGNYKSVIERMKPDLKTVQHQVVIPSRKVTESEK